MPTIGTFLEGVRVLQPRTIAIAPPVYLQNPQKQIIWIKFFLKDT